MNVELINTGSELMLGRVLNTHQQWLCRRLADLGYVVMRQVAVADTGPDIEQAVREGLARADLVVTTGGLGPTSDDLTRELVAQLLGKALREDASIVDHIQRFFAERKRPMPERTRVQALVPAGALVLPNPLGTAPGLAMAVRPNPFRTDGKASWLLMLPGPPRELQPMFNAVVVPLLGRVLPPESEFVCRTLRTAGVGESMVQEKVGNLLQPLVAAGLELGYCARSGQVDVRLAARTPSARLLVRQAEGIVREQIGREIYAVDDEDLETVVVRGLTERKQTLALAESCTGGALAHRITNVPGASAVLLAGWVTYSNEAKQQLLGVRAETLATHGAVSGEVAREMALGARQQSQADFALSVTGIAGPGGGTVAKPVGTVFLGLATPEKVLVLRNFNPYDRETFKQITAQQALEILRRTCLI
ncbi:MAG: competence/damage-inducible protein A [Verrucomicrobia bacterium]|nr:competence/damage-inducible protein A [Verrucomicrobiota bacterium]